MVICKERLVSLYLHVSSNNSKVIKGPSLKGTLQIKCCFFKIYTILYLYQTPYFDVFAH